MHQAIPYRSWQPLISQSTTTTTTPTPTTHYFTSISPLTLTITNDTHSHNPSSVSPKLDCATEGTITVLNMVSENAVIVISRRGCCMSHVVKRLLLGLGVNPGVHEVDEKDEGGVVRELESSIDDHKVQFPVVFIGGKLFGGLDRLMATHISGELVPILKQAGALWL